MNLKSGREDLAGEGAGITGEKTVGEGPKGSSGRLFIMKVVDGPESRSILMQGECIGKSSEEPDP